MTLFTGNYTILLNIYLAVFNYVCNELRNYLSSLKLKREKTGKSISDVITNKENLILQHKMNTLDIY